ncbi:LON peptidase substrate-binding domain-containing protein [bacterium]|nr:LON peptidase substrate-binding domain-containing protein [bacterium]
MIRNELPLFPLPNVVLFPDVILPLHIFEPRYRLMVDEALQTHKKIGMVLLKKGWEQNYEQNPDIFDVGCMGQIVGHERLEDGRFNILLKGVNRFSVDRIVVPAPYRQAKVALLEDRVEDLSEEDQDKTKRNIAEASAAIPEYFVYNKMRLGRAPVDFSAPLPTVIDTLAYYLAIDPYDKQPILEETIVGRRAQLLYEKMISLLQLKNVLGNSGHAGGDPDLN